MTSAVPAVDPRDDRPHPAGSSPAWTEAWLLHFASRGPGAVLLAGFVALEVAPNGRRAGFRAGLVLPGIGYALVRDDEVVMPRGHGRAARSVEVRSDGLWAEVVCETEWEHWGYGLEAFGVVLDDPWAALADERGERVPVGLDLEWERRGDPCPVPPAGHPLGAGFDQLGRVQGVLTIGRDRRPVDAPGIRRRVWGERDVTSARLAAWLDDGSGLGAAFGVDSRDGSPGMSPVARTRGTRWWIAGGPDGRDAPVVTDDVVEVQFDPTGRPRAGRHGRGAVELAWEVVADAPVRRARPGGRTEHLLQGVCEVRTGTAAGLAWLEWPVAAP